MRKRWGSWDKRGGWVKRGRGTSGQHRGGGGGSRRSTPSSLITPALPPVEPSPYYGWSDYFPDDTYAPDSPTTLRLRTFTAFFEDLLPNNTVLYQQVSCRGSITLAVEDVAGHPTLHAGLPDFRDLLRDTPDLIIRSLSLAAYHVLTVAEGGGTQSIHALPLVMVRIASFTPVTSLRDLRANLYGKFVTVQGTVVRVSDSQPLVTHLHFTCSVCGQESAHPLRDGRYSVPGSSCCGLPLSPCPGGALTRTIDLQKVRLQEAVVSDEGAPDTAGRIPRTVEVEVTADLVGSCVPGDSVLVSGVVKVNQGGREGSRGGGSIRRDQCLFLLYIHANHVTSSTSSEEDALAITAADITEISAIGKRYAFGVLVNSLCPTIFGHTLVKAGLILSLVGGRDRGSGSNTANGDLHKRVDSHVLIVGDPGLGKSQLLQAVSNIAPRGVYVCGNSTTSAGLTVTLAKDGHDTVLEAGALVLSDRGCCCIDEFDKMTSQHNALLEAMEQQSISIAKAGMVCSLPARCSVIAAANPVSGHYNPRKSIAENVKLSGPLLSRFDLIFILLDRADASLDRYLSEHVLALHAEEGNNGGRVERDEAERQLRSSTPPSDIPLEHRLQLCREVLDPRLMRKYIAHVRAAYRPVLGEDAKAVLKEFYLQLRAEDRSDETPVTTRQLESLIRLTESRAKIGQRTEATAGDALDVVEIFRYCMRDVKAVDGMVVKERKGAMGVAKAGKLLIAALNKHSERTATSLFSIPEIKEVMARSNIEVKSFDSLMITLNDQGFLLKKGSNIFQLQTSHCL